MLLTQLPLLLQLASAPAPAHFLPGLADGYAPSSAAADSILDTAREALDRGRPWQASLLVAPVGMITVVLPDARASRTSVHVRSSRKTES